MCMARRTIAYVTIICHCCVVLRIIVLFRIAPAAAGDADAPADADADSAADADADSAADAVADSAADADAGGDADADADNVIVVTWD